MAFYDIGFRNQYTARLVPQSPAIPGAIVGGALAIGGGGVGTGANGVTTYICVNANQKVQYGTLSTTGVLTWGSEIDLPGVPVPAGAGTAADDKVTDALKNSYFVAKITNGGGVPVVIWSQITDHVTQTSNKAGGALQLDPNVSAHRITTKVFTASSIASVFSCVYQPVSDVIIAPTNAQWTAGSTPQTLETDIALSWTNASYNRQAQRGGSRVL